MTDSEPLISARGLCFSWPNAEAPVIDMPAFSIESEERVFLRGPSGSGKSTLLGLISGILTPQRGELRVSGYELTNLSGGRRDRVRADHLGIIFQLFNLVPYLDVTSNILLPLRFSARRRAAVSGSPTEEVARLLSALGLDDPTFLKRRVLDLSVGQQQRVAAARALIGSPDLVIADEPTSALDTDARDRFITLLGQEASRSGAALLFVSHDHSLAARFDRNVDLMAINRAGGDDHGH